MWTSIKQIIKPGSLVEALALQQEAGSILFAGGSYLAAQRNPHISTLVNINHLLDDNVTSLATGLSVGAACSLEQLKQLARPNLAQAIADSCPSKNIRNQRTIGGEIAQGRTDSDLLVFLYAAETQLEIDEAAKLTALSTWKGQGIITRVIIPENNTRLERVAVLDSALAFVIAALQQTATEITLAVGGKSETILHCKTTSQPTEGQIREFMEKVEAVFPRDQHGSPAYKRQLVSALLQEMAVTA